MILYLFEKVENKVERPNIMNCHISSPRFNNYPDFARLASTVFLLFFL